MNKEKHFNETLIHVILLLVNTSDVISFHSIHGAIETMTVDHTDVNDEYAVYYISTFVGFVCNERV